MCRFFSAVAFRDGTIYAAPDVTDSHEDLILARGLTDNGPGIARNWCRVEYAPSEGTPLHELDKYILHIDDATPAWWADKEAEILAACRSTVQAMLIGEGSRKMLLGGCWIICGKAKIGYLKSGRAVAVYGSAQIESVYGSAQIGYVYGSARIGSVYGSAQIGYVYGSARIRSVYDAGRIVNDNRVK